jgi:putative flippase GtrA
MTTDERPLGGRRAAERAGDFLTSWVDRLPPRLRRLLPRELVGFAMLGALTFSIDLLLLSGLKAWTRLPLPVAISLAYVAAQGSNFLLNRTVNFRSHAPVGGQVVRYGLVVACDFGLTLGITTGLAAGGVDFRVARLIAAGCVAIFTYSASRWWVFRDSLKPRAKSVAAVLGVTEEQGADETAQR